MQFRRKFTAFFIVALMAIMPNLAFAAQTALTISALKINNYAVLAGDLNLTPVAMDAVNGNSFVSTGLEVLIFMNTDTVTHTVTITSTADNYGRQDTSLTGYVVPVAAGGTSGVSAIQMKQQQGWTQPGQLIYLATNSALVKILVLRTQ